MPFIERVASPPPPASSPAPSPVATPPLPLPALADYTPIVATTGEYDAVSTEAGLYYASVDQGKLLVAHGGAVHHVNRDSTHLVRHRSLPHNPKLIAYQGAVVALWTEYGNVDGTLSVFSPWRGYLAYSVRLPGAEEFTAPRQLYELYQVGEIWDPNVAEWVYHPLRGRTDHWLQDAAVAGDMVVLRTRDHALEADWILRGRFDLTQQGQAAFAPSSAGRPRRSRARERHASPPAGGRRAQRTAGRRRAHLDRRRRHVDPARTLATQALASP